MQPRTRGDTTLPKKSTMSPPHAKKTVSAAVVFKNQYQKAKRDNTTKNSKRSGSRVEMEDANGTTLLSFKQRVTEQRQPEMLLAVKSTEIGINKTLENALKTVYNRTLLPMIPNGNQQGLNASPLTLPAPAKYGRLATQTQPPPISQFILTLRHTTSEGRVIRFEQTFQERMQNYKKLVVAQKEKLAMMQKEWETVVGEIWKLGTVCVGEETMKELLCTEQRFNGPSQHPYFPSSSPSKTTDTESTVFFPKQDSSPLAKKSRPCKKHVTFLDEEEFGVCNESITTSTSDFPEFTHKVSKYQEDDLPTVPSLPEEEAKELDERIGELGTKEIEAFHKMNEDHQEFWRKKKAQFGGVQKVN
ncbi:hypothetical protein CFE70_007182 [Pyrenophora teres f. teres 0-1]|nr:hypothetical protein PTNB85_06255 [Pyrenophora teres f. teres]KAE8843601.1 hypothetical protein HRS9122_04704 [Pyrenophora teres f. teres]KAE8856612.1 hypothetical protein PTNB73_09334 [Pyrenophora teres f. teres]